MKTIVTRAAAVAAAVILLTALFSCGAKYEDAEIISAASELIEASYEINVIYFGSGLPTVPSDDTVLKHSEIAEDSPYRTKSEIMDATLAVYTEEYSEYLFEKAFTGFSVSFDEDSVDGDTVIDARYVEYGGRLVVLPIDEQDVLKLDRTYDTTGIKVVRQRGDKATVSVPSFVKAVPDDEVELTLVKTDDGWRLDTPTY